MNIFAQTGSVTIDALRETGRMAEFAGRGALAWIMGPFYWRAFFSSLIRIGFTSLPVVGLTAVFTGLTGAPPAATAPSAFDGDHWMQARPSEVVVGRL